MKILLTGATGFLGSALAKHWHGAGHALTLLVRPSSSLRRIQDVLSGVTLASCSADREIVELVRQTAPDLIVHTACAYGRNAESVLQVFDTNIRLGLLLLEGVLGSAENCVGFVNTGTVLDPSVGNYALSKHHFAQWGDTVAKQNSDRLKFVNIRLQHMYGPGDDQYKFTSRVLHACQGNQPKLALTAGEQRRDFIFIDDVVTAYDAVVHNLDSFSQSDQIDVGSGNAPTVRCFVEHIHALTSSLTELQFGAIAYRENEAMFCQADTSRLQSFGWQAAYSLDQGIRKTIELEFNP